LDASERRHVEIDHEGQVVCSADVTIDGADQPTAMVALHAEPGHVPPGSRGHLVDRVLALPEVQRTSHLSAALPRGDDESLQRLRERCDDVTAHPAGATVLVEGTPRTSSPG
jgi:hypothetical protein